ncbi:MAG: RNA methyltransferase [Chlorogloea purpurea SAG 13.99]|nr:RNA methyltransferase [Chlorogloea purpurea SAG 13.99]
MISSLQNTLVKQVRRLHRSKGRREENLFLIEGTHLLQTACESNCSLEILCFTEKWRQLYPQLSENGEKISKRVELVTTEVLGAMATTVNPDGVIAVIARGHVHPSIVSPLRLGLVLERIQDPGNLGTIIRTAVATGVDALWLSGDSVEIDNPKVLRASAGEWFRVPIAVREDLSSLIEDYKKEGVRIIATLPTAQKTYWEIDWTVPSLIVVGNEGGGLSRELVSLCDEGAKIPLANGVESLNVGIATAVILYEARRQWG